MAKKVIKEKAIEETLWQSCDKLRGSVETAEYKHVVHCPEFNRYGWFISDGSVRASLEWERFCDIEVPVLDIKIQEAIITIYHTLETHKKINERLKDSIKPLCPVLMRGVVDEMELLIENA